MPDMVPYFRSSENWCPKREKKEIQEKFVKRFNDRYIQN